MGKKIGRHPRRRAPEKRKSELQIDADYRKSLRAKRSDAEQLILLDSRPGGSVKERTRLGNRTS